MKKLRWQLIIIFVTGIILAVLLLSQQGGGGPLIPQPVEGGSYTEALVGTYQRFNPVLDSYNPADQEMDRLLFSSLLRFDYRGMPVGELAQSWGVSQDGTVVNVVLKPDLKWSDGEPLTAGDVVFTIDLMRNGGNYVPKDTQDFWNNVDVVDLTDTVLQFRLTEPYAPFLDYLTFGVVPQHILNGLKIDAVVNHSFNYNPVGSGPFMIDHAIVENGKMAGVALVPNNHYYGQKAYIQQFTLRYYTDPTSAYKAYKDGTVQGISNVTPDILADVLKESNLAVYSARKPEMSILLLNLNNADVAFFKDVVVRKAILAAINRQAIIDKVLHGQGILANGPIFPESWAYFFTQPVDFDPAQAVFNLKQDGYKLSTDKNSILTKDNQAIKFTLAYPDDPTHQKIAESIQSDLAGINIQVDLQAVSYDKLMSDYLDTRKYQAALVDFNFTNAIDPDPYPFWDQSMATGGQNYSQWNNSMASEYLETARTTVDFNERSRLYRNFQVIFADEQPALPLYYPIYNFAVDNKVQGISVGSFYNTSDRFATVAQWFIQAERGASSSTATPGK